jgi:hypothetical protein
MISERDKMLAGELYNANDPELVALRRRARALCRDLEHLSLEDVVGHRRILSNLLGVEAPDVHVEAPFGPGVRQADHDRLRRLGRRSRDPLPRSHDRRPLRDWGRQRRHPRYPRRGHRRRQPLPRAPADLTGWIPRAEAAEPGPPSDASKVLNIPI